MMLKFKTKVPKPINEVTPIIMKMIDGELQEVRRYPTSSNSVTNAASRNMWGTLNSNGGSATYGENTVIDETGGMFRYLELGTGTATITPETTALGNASGTYTEVLRDSMEERTTMVEEGGVWYWQVDLTYIFTLGQVVGTFTEFGCSYYTPGSGNYTLFSGGLFKDTGGNPVAITVGSDEQLFISYRFKMECVSDGGPDWDGSESSTFDVWETLVDGDLISVNGSDYAIRVIRKGLEARVYGGSAGKITTLSPREGEEDCGYVYSTAGSFSVDQGNNSDKGTFQRTKRDVAPDGLSVTYAWKIVVAPGAGFPDVNRVRFANHGTSLGDNSFNLYFTPEIPFGATESMEINVEWTVDWS